MWYTSLISSLSSHTWLDHEAHHLFYARFSCLFLVYHTNYCLHNRDIEVLNHQFHNSRLFDNYLLFDKHLYMIKVISCVLLLWGHESTSNYIDFYWTPSKQMLLFRPKEKRKTGIKYNQEYIIVYCKFPDNEWEQKWEKSL